MTHRPSRPLTLALGLAIGLAAAGCWQPNSTPLAPAALQVTVPGEGSVTAVARLAPTDAEGRQLLAFVVPWKKADLHHVRLALYEGDATTALVSRDVAQADLDTPLTFNNLKKETSYRLIAQAWADQAELNRIDNGATDAASCTTSFTTTTAEKLEVGALKLKLKAKTFAGATNGSPITVTDGALAEPTATEAVMKLKSARIFAGGSTSGFVDGTGAAARFNSPYGVAVDASGNLYVGDFANFSVRKVTPSGVVTTLAGDGTDGYADGTGASAKFSRSFGLGVDSAGNVIVADEGNHRIRKITPAGVVTTLAGDGTAGLVDGTGTAARFNTPRGVALDASDNIYLTEYGNHTIRKITPAGVVTTVAGNGTMGFVDGTGSAARFKVPTGIALDAAGNMYVVDQSNHSVRKVTPAGVVTTFAGDGTSGYADGAGAAAKFNQPFGVAVDAQGVVYVTDRYNHRLRKITPEGVVSTLAGYGGEVLESGTSSPATLSFPAGVAIDAQGTIYLTESGHSLRKLH